MSIYLDRYGKQITQRQHLLMAEADNGDTWLLAQVEQSNVRIELLTHAILGVNPRSVPEKFWGKFRVDVTNIERTDVFGEPLESPIERKDPLLSDSYTTLEAAVEAAVKAGAAYGLDGDAVMGSIEILEMAFLAKPKPVEVVEATDENPYGGAAPTRSKSFGDW